MATTSRGIVLQPRDLEVLRGLYESRIMTRQHIADMYFDCKAESAKKRIQKLIGAGLIVEQPSKPNDPKPICLAKAGYELLAEHGVLNDFPDQGWRSFQKRVQVSDATLRHELEVLSIKAAFVRSMRDYHGLQLAEFSTWPKLYEFRAKRPVVRDGYTYQREMLMKPDGFIRIHQDTAHGTAEHCFFLELDRGTETLNTVASKILGYRSYFQTGGFAKRMGCDPNAPADCPFRVLVVASSDARIKNIAEVLLNQSPPIQTLAWLANFDSVIEDPLSSCWTRPMDARADATANGALNLLD